MRGAGIFAVLGCVLGLLAIGLGQYIFRLSRNALDLSSDGTMFLSIFLRIMSVACPLMLIIAGVKGRDRTAAMLQPPPVPGQR